MEEHFNLDNNPHLRKFESVNSYLLALISFCSGIYSAYTQNIFEHLLYGEIAGIALAIKGLTLENTKYTGPIINSVFCTTTALSLCMISTDVGLATDNTFLKIIPATLGATYLVLASSQYTSLLDEADIIT